MAKQQIKKPTVKKSSSDTTKIPKPYKISKSEISSSPFRTPDRDSTSMKTYYNNKVVKPAVVKRNMERLKEGKPMIPTASFFGATPDSYNPLISSKGKTFKEAPLKTIKIKKKK